MVKREGGKVWIEGVPTLGWARHRECTFAGALEAALAPTKRPYTYADLMGYSGLAFRVRWYQAKEGRDWCPSSPVGEFPEEQAAISKATGWQLRCECLLGQAEPHMERFAPEIAASIDAGVPVLAYEPRLNVDTVFGYLDDARLALGQFLRDATAILDGDARDALGRATALYEKESGFLGSVFGRKDAFLGPWSGKSLKDWTPEVRAREWEILVEAQKIEADAIEEIEKALAAER